MPFIPTPDVLQYNARFACGGQQIENVFHFSYAGSDFATAAAALFNLVQDEWWLLIRAGLSNQLTSTGSYIVDQSSVSGPVASFGAFTSPAGASSIFSAPNNAAFVVTHRTAQRGRSFRGRSYISGIPADQINGSRVSSGFLSTAVSAFNNMRVEAAAALYPFVIVSRFTNGSPRTTGVASEVTACVAVDDAVDSQRRRLPGRGN